MLLVPWSSVELFGPEGSAFRHFEISGTVYWSTPRNIQEELTFFSVSVMSFILSSFGVLPVSSGHVIYMVTLLSDALNELCFLLYRKTDIPKQIAAIVCRN
jgi:hypothetical protein